MGQKQAAYDTTGKIVGFYDSEDSPAPKSASLLEITDAQWQECLATPGYTIEAGALVAPPPPTAAQLLGAGAQKLLAGTVSITSTSTPALNGSYAITQADQVHISAEVQSIMLNGTFADGTGTCAWSDASGAIHTFPSIAEFKAFATAIGSFVAACYKALNGASTALPSTSITIA